MLLINSQINNIHQNKLSNCASGEIILLYLEKFTICRNWNQKLFKLKNTFLMRKVSLLLHYLISWLFGVQRFPSLFKLVEQRVYLFWLSKNINIERSITFGIRNFDAIIFFTRRLIKGHNSLCRREIILTGCHLKLKVFLYGCRKQNQAGFKI